MNVAKIDNNALNSDDLVKWLKLSGRFEELIYEFINVKLAAAAAKRRGVTVSTDEIQERADEYRRVEGLYRAKDANTFLDEAGVTLDDFEAYITDAVVEEKMYTQLTDDKAVEKYFKLNSPKFDAIEIKQIVVASEDRAKELMSILKDDPNSFAAVAREHSIDDTADEGGGIGKLRRGSLGSDIEAKLFNAAEGDLVGPLVDNERGFYHLFMIYAKHPASLNDEDTAGAVRNLIYDEWLGTRRDEHKVEIL